MPAGTWRLGLHLAAPGREYVQVHVRREGFDGRHEVVLPDRPGPAIRLRWRDDGTPVADQTVVMLDAQGEIFDEGRSEADGMVRPLWPPWRGWACLDLSIERGTIRFPLERAHVLRHRPLEIAVPRIGQAHRLDVACRNDAGLPVSGARIRLHIADGDGGVLDCVTDRRGRGRSHFWLARDDEDVSAGCIASVTAAWISDRGTVCHDHWMVEERPPVLRETPFLVHLVSRGEAKRLGSIPVLVHVSGSPAVPDRVSCNLKEVEGSDLPYLSGQWKETPGTTVLDPDGRRPRRLVLHTDADGWPWPAGSSLIFGVRLAGRREVVLTVPVANVRRSLKTGSTLVLDAPGIRYRNASVLVTRPDGKPSPFPRAYLHVSGRYQSLIGDETGRVFAGRLPADRTYRIVALDTSTGAGGQIAEFRPFDAEEPTVLRLNESRVLQFRVLRKGGSVPGALRATLADRAGKPSLAPSYRGVLEDDNLITFPPVALELYDVVVRAIRTKAVRLPADEVGEMIVID
ncbi:MAG: hypothetical protein ABFS86_09095 [Planctomycetota bacterium]